MPACESCSVGHYGLNLFELIVAIGDLVDYLPMHGVLG
jgi:hypothetical protein